MHEDTCLGGDAISPNGSRALGLSSLCFTVVFPEDGVIEWGDRVSKDDETEVNGSPPLPHSSQRLSLVHNCSSLCFVEIRGLFHPLMQERRDGTAENPSKQPFQVYSPGEWPSSFFVPLNA